MSTLKTTNLQNADASSANIVLGQGSGGGATITGVTTTTTLQIADDIIHTGDTNTKIRFPSADTITAETGGSERVRIDSSGRLMVGSTTEGFATYGDKFTIADSGHCGMTIRSGSSSDGNIYFSDGTSGSDEVRGFVEYNHSINRLQLGTNGSAKLSIDINGNTNISGITTATHFVPSAQPYGTRNYIINGDMRIVQRGVSTTTINEYIIDRWRNYGGPADATWSRQTDATAYPRSRYALRQQRTSGTSQTNNTGVGQGIETKNSYALAGQAVTLTFKARCGANFSAASNQLTSRINGGEGTDQNPFSMTNTNGSSQNNVLTTSVQTFTHKWTIPSDKTQVTVMFDYNPVGTAGANDWFEVAEVQLEVGSVATPFEYLSFGEQLALCQRYFTKSYDYDTYYTDTDSGDEYSGALIQRSIGSTSANILFGEYPVPMRAAPTVTVRGPTAATDAAATIRGSGNTAISVGGFQLGNGPRLMGIYFTSNQANSYISAHYYADAEL